MGRHDPEDYSRLRQLLSRHPALVEATRLAAAVTSRPAEIAVFQRSWAYIVAASSGHVLQPRRLTASEWDLLDDPPDDDTYADENTTSFPILDPGGEVVAALTIQSLAGSSHNGVLSSLARLVNGVIATQDCDRPIPAGGTRGVEVAAVPDALRDAVVVLDSALDVIWANDAVGSLFGRSRFDLIGRNAAELVHPEDLPVAVDAMARLTEGLRLYRVFVRVSHGDGDWSPVEITGTDQSANPRIGGIVISLRSAELDEEIQLEQAVTHHITEALVEQLHDGMVATDAVGSISIVNRSAYELFGIDPETPPGRLTWRDFPLLDFHGTPVGRENHPLRVMFGVRFAGPTEMSVLSPRGEHRYVTVAHRTVADEDGTVMGSFVTFHDVTEAREAQLELETQARHDHLTGLPNRRMLTERLERLAVTTEDREQEEEHPREPRHGGEAPPERETRYGRDGYVAACFLDLDVFKLINDTHGHRTGDHLIRVAAQRLSRRLREGDLLVRHGGDEFVAVLHGLSSPREALEGADRLRRSLTEPFAIEGTSFDVTASAGVAVCSVRGCDPDDLLRQADIALYAAKARGRNQTVLFDDELEVLTEVAERQRRMLRHALDHDGIVMHFQPLVDSQTGRPVAFEALARCLDPEGVLHGPGSFLDSISSSGMIWELDQRAFQLSCEAAALLQRIIPADTPVIGCNFSPLSIVQPGFTAFIERTVARAGVEPANICVEITETAAFAGGRQSLEAVTTLHRAGFKIALDDFGTGYSSLSHLRDLPLDSVKMDRSFVARFTEDGPERAIAEAVVGLAGDLGLGVVAEGVETHEQLVVARGLGFRTIQGWHYDRAMPLDELLHRWVGTLRELATTTS